MPLEPADIAHLASTRTVDLTTIGRRSGQPRTVEIWWFLIDGRFVITGTPGRRDWLANVRGNPEIVISTTRGDFPATAVEIGDGEFRRKVFTRPETSWYSSMAELEVLVEESPMIELRFD